MADNLLDMAVRQLGSGGIGALGNALGLPDGKGQSALTSGLATVVAGMLNKSGSSSGLGSLFNMVTGSSGLDLSSMADAFGDPSQMSSLQKSGGNMLDTIFGSKAGGATNALSSALGLSGGTGGSLLKVAAPIVLSLIGKMVKSKGLDIGGLASLLMGQKSFIKDSLPSGVLKELGISSLDKIGASVDTGHREAVQGVKHHEVKKRGGWGKWLWPLLIALGALYALNMCAKREHVEKPAVIEEESVIVEEAPVQEPVVETPKTVVPDTAVSDFGTSFREYLASAARDPNREFPLTIEFPADGSTPTSASFPDVQALVKILQENAALTIAIEGHTDSDGDEAQNQQLSEMRAQAVRQMLVDAGIDGNRVTATGMGSAKPIADNSTEEGKQQNRRISVRVVTFE
jgi:outer membrane protein OmpA-like peptidoglycan-associated protein